MASNIIACRKIGWRLVFKTYQQRLHHEEKCNKKKVEPKSNYVELEAGKFMCSNCIIVICQRNNLKRHTVYCKGMKTLNICPTCGKTFQYKSKLNQHVNQVHRHKNDESIDHVVPEIDEIE